MPNLRIYHGRAEQAADLRERFAVVLTRATAPPRMALRAGESRCWRSAAS